VEKRKTPQNAGFLLLLCCFQGVAVQIGTVAEPKGVEPVTFDLAPAVAQPSGNAVLGGPVGPPDGRQVVTGFFPPMLSAFGDK
jgi:hypothetical protein